MAGRIADDGKLLAGELLHLGFNTRPLSAEVFRAVPPIRSRGGGPFGQRKMEWTRKEPFQGEKEANGYRKPDDGGTDGLSTRPPNTEVAHALQTDGIEGRCERREIVRNKKYLDHHAGSEDQHAQNQEAETGREYGFC
jgi:hypothetical protein